MLQHMYFVVHTEHVMMSCSQPVATTRDPCFSPPCR